MPYLEGQAFTGICRYSLFATSDQKPYLNVCTFLLQVLPLVPPDPQFFSPYSGTDANCGNPLLICLEGLINDGLLQPNDRPAPVRWPSLFLP